MNNGSIYQDEPYWIEYGYRLNGCFYIDSPYDPQCRGIGVNGERCRRDWNLNCIGYCHTHATQGPRVEDPPSWALINRCQGIAKSTGCQCLKDWEIFDNGLCIYHQAQAPYRPTYGYY
ncbi:hypothetical protein ON010_g7590 [Phytophthora cinnamomi]|nr:hypothetical protein ON010_g7590 [Phytophthora cinnamomi]